MKIEKINDKQIRCILNQADLADRNLLLSELAYGSQKARALFSDMMQKASNELGFEVQDTPLMIEAIPISPDCLVLIVTKVDEPDELDTRFSRFSSADPDEYFSDYDDMEDEDDEEEDEETYFLESNLLNDEHTVLDLMNVLDASVNPVNLNDFVPLKETLSHTPFIQSLKEKKEEEKALKRLFHVISFTNFNVLIKASRSLGAEYPGESMLYKNPVTSTYYLVIYRGNQDSNRYHHYIHVLCEYGKLETTSFGTLSYYNEHFTPMLSQYAVNVLSKLA
ncbi:MAG: adaptor protein MecA [Lachnospiraceae bacterium]|nr:adaptor protein MecA [Lachnospiraceae bacterium]